MADNSDNRIVFTMIREFRDKLRDWVDEARVSKKEVIIQNKGKNVAVLISLDRWLELREKAGEKVSGEQLNKVLACNELHPSSEELVTCVGVTA